MSAVRAIVVHRERPEAALETVTRLSSAGTEVRVTVVDSGSSDAAIATLRERLPGDAELMVLGRNAGFGPGANAALRPWLDATDEPWALVAPHDAAPEGDCVERLLAELNARPKAAMASAEYGDGEAFRPTVDRFFGASFVPAEPGDGWESVDYAHGTLLALRQDAMRDVGLFDERFFAYCEEADLSIRARDVGWDVGLVWGAVVANGRPPRADTARYLQLRNTLLLLEKHFGWRAVLTRVTWELAVLLTGGVGPTTGVGLGQAERDLGRERRAVRRSTALALRDYARRRFGPPPSEVMSGTPARA